MESAGTIPIKQGIQEIRLNFTLLHWCLWRSGAASTGEPWPDGEVLPCKEGSADVGFLSMMQSRRLSPLARAACAVAWHCRQQCGDMSSVFFSNHGESQYYFEMLQGMAESEEVSPSRFSLCVHNAIAGLSSFHSESHMPYVSLAGGTEGIFTAFLEAAGMLLETPKVLVVCYEQALPEVYSPYCSISESTWALGMVLSSADGPGRQLRLLRRPNLGKLALEDCGQNLLETILTGRRSSSCRLDKSVWQLSLDDA